MKVLVAYASAHGSTRGIAERIAAGLTAGGHEATAAAIDREGAIAGGVAAFDAVVLGSAIHNSRWLPEADAFARANAAALRDRRTWLFSVLTVGNSSAALGRPFAWLVRRLSVPGNLATLRATLRPAGIRRFAGVISAEDMGRVGAAFVRLTGGSCGDHRDWRDIDAWAASIARALGPGSAAAA